MSTRPSRETCGVPGCLRFGRRFVSGWWCDSHRPPPSVAVKTLDGPESASALAWVEQVRKAATYALRMGVPFEALRDALLSAQEGYLNV
jgi:hypothetical protein